eukprot:CAMPEP_0172549516 /NCGR_PEP_ID=MMETSP1067-20121228/18574_1 /TAXON_ID=265564 ORGANISM="Thalassiosira punctigera, Strain Tpunct2005C2" /NCGR_SAMPLE_ID=MMETSP1067 /ASSEMBLY_ACC=CAM_ASM_000444 /LENGTH=537 /DNA_ID=CAMNT_0013336909 /DNA_START=328 /DNA_END=1937 /DNA_ORIENTATION=+
MTTALPPNPDVPPAQAEVAIGACGNDAARNPTFVDEEIASVEGEDEVEQVTVALVTSLAEVASSKQPPDGAADEEKGEQPSQASDPSPEQSKGGKGGGVSFKAPLVSSSPGSSPGRTRYSRVSKAVAVTSLSLPPPGSRKRKPTKHKGRSALLLAAGQALDPSSLVVPNPLAGIQAAPAPAGNEVVVTSTTNTLMSAAPQQEQVHPPDPSSGMGGQFANIAESMSSQRYQTDGLAAAESDAAEGMPAAPQPHAAARGRIFSIDLDPAVLDFVGPDQHGGTGESSYQRDRGFSFECFTFGINHDEPPPQVPAAAEPVSVAPLPSRVASRPRGDSIMWDPASLDGGVHESPAVGNRLRGDSIIFNPTSFCDGGIHETWALDQIQQTQLPVVPEAASSSSIVPSAATPISTSLAPASAVAPAPMAPMASAPMAPPPQVKPPPLMTHNRYGARPSKKSAGSSRGPSSARHKQVRTAANSSRGGGGGGVPQPFSEDTIHMPRGSAAAAAASIGLPDGREPSSSSASSPADGAAAHAAGPPSV